MRNRVIVACAGSGKTHTIATEALKGGHSRPLILTYTNSNLRQLEERLRKLNNGIYPQNVTCMTWHRFLVNECANPYRHEIHRPPRFGSLSMSGRPKPHRGTAKSNPTKYYFDQNWDYYIDTLGDFVCTAENRSCQAISHRLSKSYSTIFVDEFQDLVGWDLAWLLYLIKETSINTFLVGDPRQCILQTNHSNKLKNLRGPHLVPYLQTIDGKYIQLEIRNKSRRCNQSICCFANRIWGGTLPIAPTGQHDEEPDSVRIVRPKDVHNYISRTDAHILAHNKNSEDYGYGHTNFGKSKGLEWKHIAIIPTQPISNFLKTLSPSSLNSPECLYVAVTRASHSVAFITDKEVHANLPIWIPS